MVKVYTVDTQDYVAYYKNEEHIYLVCIEPHCEEDRFIRIKVSDKDKKTIMEYECCYTFTWGEPQYREFIFTE